MPSDSDWDEYYNSIDARISRERNKLKDNLTKMFESMSSEEKLKYLVDQHIQDKVYQIRSGY